MNISKLFNQQIEILKNLDNHVTKKHVESLMVEL